VPCAVFLGCAQLWFWFVLLVLMLGWLGLLLVLLVVLVVLVLVAWSLTRASREASKM